MVCYRYISDGQVVPFGDKENILGTRWMALAATGDTPPAKGYGIHGTWDESSLGQQSSAGCIRMANRDVEELFVYIPVGAKAALTIGTLALLFLCTAYLADASYNPFLYFRF